MLVIMLACVAEPPPGGVDSPEDTAPPPPDRALLRERLAEAGIVPLEAPPEVPTAVAELGKRLNADPILSGNKNISCATCHQPALGGDDDRPTAIGQGGEGVGTARTGVWSDQYVGRNSPTMFNAHLLGTMLWDGGVSVDAEGGLHHGFGGHIDEDLAARLTYGAAALQALGPLTVSDEMLGFRGENTLADHLDTNDWSAIWADLTARVVAIEEYRPFFEAAWPGVAFEDITIGEIADAIGGMEIAAYASNGSPFDHFLAGDDAALSDAAVRGGLLFTDPEGPNCASCHSGPLLTDLQTHNTLLAQYGKGKPCDGAMIDEFHQFDDFGAECATHQGADRYRFRTPPLRNLGVSAPYGHAGQYRSLEAFLQHYVDPEASLMAWDPAKDQDDPVLASTALDTREAVLSAADPALVGIHLDPAQIPDLVAFLEALDDPAAKDLGEWLPESVPSGLPVDRPE